MSPRSPTSLSQSVWGLGRASIARDTALGLPPQGLEIVLEGFWLQRRALYIAITPAVGRAQFDEAPRAEGRECREPISVPLSSVGIDAFYPALFATSPDNIIFAIHTEVVFITPKYSTCTCCASPLSKRMPSFHVVALGWHRPTRLGTAGRAPGTIGSLSG